MGHARRRGNRWELRAYLGRDTLTGAKRYTTRMIDAPNQRHANRAMADWETDLRRTTSHTNSDGANATFGDLLEAW